MRFLADESLDGPIVAALRAVGHDVSYIAEFSAGAADEEVLRLSHADDRILITADKDFGELVHRRRLPSHGVVLVRVEGMPPRAKPEFVCSAITENAVVLPGGFTVISPGPVRVRRSP